MNFSILDTTAEKVRREHEQKRRWSKKGSSFVIFCVYLFRFTDLFEALFGQLIKLYFIGDDFGRIIVLNGKFTPF